MGGSNIQTYKQKKNKKIKIKNLTIKTIIWYYYVYFNTTAMNLYQYCITKQNFVLRTKKDLNTCTNKKCSCYQILTKLNNFIKDYLKSNICLQQKENFQKKETI